MRNASSSSPIPLGDSQGPIFIHSLQCLIGVLMHTLLRSNRHHFFESEDMTEYSVCVPSQMDPAWDAEYEPPQPEADADAVQTLDDQFIVCFGSMQSISSHD